MRNFLLVIIGMMIGIACTTKSNSSIAKAAVSLRPVEILVTFQCSDPSAHADIGFNGSHGVVACWK